MAPEPGRPQPGRGELSRARRDDAPAARRECRQQGFGAGDRGEVVEVGELQGVHPVESR